MKIACLLLVLMLIPASYATSSCPAGRAYPTTCKCASGKVETYYNAEDFAEARDDPDSCCYYKPTQQYALIPQGDGTYYFSNKIPVGAALPPRVGLGLDEVETVEVYEIMPQEEVFAVEAPVEPVELETYEIEVMPQEYEIRPQGEPQTLLRVLRAWFQSAFRPLPPIGNRISSLLSS